VRTRTRTRIAGLLLTVSSLGCIGFVSIALSQSLGIVAGVLIGLVAVIAVGSCLAWLYYRMGHWHALMDLVSAHEESPGSVRAADVDLPSIERILSNPEMCATVGSEDRRRLFRFYEDLAGRDAAIRMSKPWEPERSPEVRLLPNLMGAGAATVGAALAVVGYVVWRTGEFPGFWGTVVLIAAPTFVLSGVWLRSWLTRAKGALWTGKYLGLALWVVLLSILVFLVLFFVVTD